ncbi:hypothetical protein RE428_13550 [Marinobacter nanhaiticus D15-8W]|nr:mechanosensitive ion channel domain-containing protein [Marinobacter nanhaiticus]BES70337.1 hypothetical protein RE428_13550 [Marinobacter nanhaiticus D15-8W]
MMLLSKLHPGTRPIVFSLFGLLLILISVTPAVAQQMPQLLGGEQQQEGEQQQQEGEQAQPEQGEQAKNGKSAPGEEQPEEEPAPKPTGPPVQPDIDDEVAEPEPLDLPSATSAGIRQQIQSLRDSLDQQQAALEASSTRLAYAQSLLKRLNNEYESFQLRLERAGLNVTEEYASLLRQRLDRLQRQTIADSLTDGIQKKLSTAREEQLKLEEFEASLDRDIQKNIELKEKRSELIRQLHDVITSHIDVLNEYFTTVADLRERVLAYQELLQQRLFWLPSAQPFALDTLGQLYQAAVWLVTSFKPSELVATMKASIDERGARMLLMLAVLIAVVVKRKTIRKNIATNGEFVGNVGKDRFSHTLLALLNSILLVFPGVLALSIVSLLLMEGNEFFKALSQGFTAAAFIVLLLSFVNKVARNDGLGERHFKWNGLTLRVIRRQIPILLAVLVPITILLPTMQTPDGAAYSDSLGRVLFTIASIALAFFAQRVMITVRRRRMEQKVLRMLHWLAVTLPLVLAAASLWGYHYTAVQLEGNLFISICWLAFTMLVYYLGLRGLSVRERRMTLQRLREQRAAERKLAEAKEAAENTGEGLPQAYDMPEMDLKDISQQSTALLRILTMALALSGLWMLWEGVIPALQLFDSLTLWTITTGIEGSDPIPITLGDLLFAILAIAATVLAAKNLPGTLEVMVLSRMNLQPGAGYAIITIVTYLIIILGVTLSLAVIGLQWSKLQWLVAALGVGLGFGLQEIVANFISGIILLFERPIRVGDTVTIGGITGTVSRIRIRATTLVDWDRKEQIIPNKTFVTQDLTNWTLTDPIVRVIVRVGVAYGSDVDKVQEVLSRVAESNARVVDDPAPAVFCVGLGESSIDFEVRVFIQDLLDYMPLAHELHSSITRELRDAGFQIPFPQRDIHVRSWIDSKTGEETNKPDGQATPS